MRPDTIGAKPQDLLDLEHVLELTNPGHTLPNQVKTEGNK